MKNAVTVDVQKREEETEGKILLHTLYVNGRQDSVWIFLTDILHMEHMLYSVEGVCVHVCVAAPARFQSEHP